MVDEMRRQLTALVVEKPLKRKGKEDLKNDRHKSQQAPRAEVIMIGIHGATIYEV